MEKYEIGVLSKSGEWMTPAGYDPIGCLFDSIEEATEARDTVAADTGDDQIKIRCVQVAVDDTGVEYFGPWEIVA